MIKSHGKALLSEQGLSYISSLTKSQIRTLIKNDLVQLELFDEDLHEVEGPDGKRWVLRLNKAMRSRARSRRADQFAKVQAEVDRRNEKVESSPRAKPSVSLKRAESALKRYKMDRFVEAKLVGSGVVLTENEAARHEIEALDGCYVVESNVLKGNATTQQLWDRYGDLQKVERNFRTLKTAHLEIRPVYHRKESRTRGLALVAMLALKIVRAFERKIEDLDLTVPEALDRLATVRLVTMADPSLGLWRLPMRWDKSVAELLAALPKISAPMLSLASGDSAA